MPKVAAKKTTKKSSTKTTRGTSKKSAGLPIDLPASYDTIDSPFSSYESETTSDFFRKPEPSSPITLVDTPSFEDRPHSFFKKFAHAVKKIRFNRQIFRNKWVLSLLLLLLSTALYSIFSNGSSIPDNEKIVKMVSRHILLPEGEVPIIMSIGEAEKLPSSQSFFNDAKNGDYLLVFERAGKAIIYSPDHDLIINSGSIARQ